MPRCLMAKKWKAYPWPDRVEDSDTLEEEIAAEDTAVGRALVEDVNLQEKRDRSEPEEEEIDVVGDVDNRQGTQTCWSPHSPTAGATAPSPPPLNASGALYYHGEFTPSVISHVLFHNFWVWHSIFISRMMLTLFLSGTLSLSGTLFLY